MSNNLLQNAKPKNKSENPYMETFLKIMKDPQKFMEFNLSVGVYDKDGNLTKDYIPNDRRAP